MSDIIAFIKPDKRGHFLIGTVLSWILSFIWVAFQPPFLLLVAVQFAFSAGKELRDWWTGKGTPEFMDFVYTFVPILPIWALLHQLGFEVLS